MAGKDGTVYIFSLETDSGFSYTVANTGDNDNLHIEFQPYANLAHLESSLAVHGRHRLLWAGG
jgi:hypothetical protein